MNVIPPITITDAMFTSSTAVETAPAAYAAGTTYGWDISTGVYAGKKLSVAGQEKAPQGLAFSTDGTKAYIVGDVNDTIYQYTLATPWDISTGAYANKSMSVAAQDINPQSLAFSTDGTKAYVCGYTNDTVYQYTLTTAWDISTGSYATKSMSVAAQEPAPHALFFSADGTKAYVCGTTNSTIYQYTLSTPWDISTGSYATKSLSVAGQEASPYGLALSADGTKAFVVGGTNRTIYQYTIGTAWDISTGAYASKSLSVVARAVSPSGLAMSADGSKIYFVDYALDTIYQYTLVAPTVSVASVPLGAYASKSLSVTAQDTEPYGVAFSTDGTKAYVLGHTNDTIYQYTLSTAWNVSTGTYASKSLSVTAQATDPRGLAFSFNGTKAYITGATGSVVYQYTLSTAWDISTGSYASKSLSVAAQITVPAGLTFNTDGTKCYVVGGSSTIYQYALSTAWDISTGTYASKSLNVFEQESSPISIAFTFDGIKAYILGYNTDTIYQYALTIAWDISTAVYTTKSLSVAAEDTNPFGFALSPDNTKAYVMGFTSDTIYQYSLSESNGLITTYRSIQATNVGHTPSSSPTWWEDIGDTYPVYAVASTYALGDTVIDATNHLVYESLVSGNVGQSLTDDTKWLELGPTNKWAAFDLLRNTRTVVPLHLEVNITPGVRADSLALMGLVADSARIMVLRGGEIFYDYSEDFTARSATDWEDYDYPVVPTSPGVVVFDLPVEYDLSKGVYSGKSLSVAGQENAPQGLAFSTDGTKAYIVGDVNDTIYQYTLATPWDISTGSYASKSLSVGAQDSNPQGIAFSTDGTKAYIVGYTNDSIYQYTLSTAWDISTGSYASKSLSVAAQETAPHALFFSADGTKAYVCGTANDTIYQYTLATPWDISTGSYATKSLSVAAQETAPYGLACSADGTKVFAIGGTNKTIYQYNLATAWDISTGAYASKSLSVAAQDTVPIGVAFSADGTKAYVVGYASKTIYQYALPPADTSSNVVKVEFYKATGNVEVGAMVLGNAVYIGDVSNDAAEADVLNFSTVTRDFAGATSLIVQRPNVPKTNQQLLLANSRINAVRAVRDYLNAVPAVWVGIDSHYDPRFDALLILGFYKRFTIRMTLGDYALIDLELEEI